MTAALFVGALALLLVLGEPLFLLLGGSAVLCFVLFGDVRRLSDLTPMVERIRSLADQQTLLAIPLFMLSGSIMAKGDIAKRLIHFARALLGWLPGGMAISGIGACLLFASITGSSTATLVAIGGLVYPALQSEKYRDDFSFGLVTTAGSIGILVPPSIPMIIYCLFNTGTKVDIEKLWLAGVGPALTIAACLGVYSMVRSAGWRIRRYPFSPRALLEATRDGFWALLLPGLILGGIYSGIFTAVEAAASAAVYAVLVEVYFHGGLRWRQIPAIFADTILLLGSFIVMIVMAMALADFFTAEGIPERAAAWIVSLHLSPAKFLLALDLLLLIVCCLMDIMSALMVFVPLIAPMAAAIGIDPIHLGVVFIVNLEIGYLTPPIGLNLFLACSLFKKGYGQAMRYTAPFVLLMLGCLCVVTWVPSVSLSLVELTYGYHRLTPAALKRAPEPSPAGAPRPAPAPGQGKVRSMKELLDEADDAPREPGK
jgi:C4-dicarboxylate transporter DctM subunit